MTKSQLSMASRDVDQHRFEFDSEDFIAFAAPFLRHGWKLAAGQNLYYDSSFELSHYTHSVLLYRVRPDDGQVEYRTLGDYGRADPIPRVIPITNSEQRSTYYHFSHGYWFVHFATVFPNVKPTKTEQKQYGIDATGHGETWPEDIVDEEMARTLLRSTPRPGLDNCKKGNLLRFSKKETV
ncbi:MAG: hypothetical protein WC784_04970 [Candidatus Shapirobacteria bacterium]